MFHCASSSSNQVSRRSKDRDGLIQQRSSPMIGSSFLAPSVSVVTVYYNCPEEILALQASMKQHLPDGEFEWIVADNQSREELSQKLPEAVYLRLPENFGFAKANNLAVQRATAPNLFFINPDCLFVENCLPPLLDALQN